MTKNFNQKVEALAQLSKPKIAFGLKEPDPEILNSLQESQKYAEIVLVGPETIGDIKNFEIITSDNPEEKIATMLVNNEVGGIVRGTVDDFKTIETYKKLTGEKSELNPALLEDPFGRQFFLSPASNPEGWQKEERLKIAQGIAKFVKEWKIEPKIAIFAAERHETYPRKKHIRDGITGILNQTYEDALWLVKKLKEKDYEAKNWSIDFNLAVEAGANILISVNGMVGNQIFRVLLFCGGKLLIGTRLGLSRCYEDNSRTEKDFLFHIKWLVAMINQKTHQ